MNLRRIGFANSLSALSLALAALCLALVAPPAAQAYDYSYARVVRLSLVDGDVQVARPYQPDEQQPDQGSGQQAWEQAVVNLPVQQGYSIATGRGRAEIEFESGATARLSENSVLQFTELALSSGARITKLTLTQGTAIFYANLAREDSFIVMTPTVQVGVPENARFRVDVYDEGSSVSGFKGNVEVDSRAGSTRLTKGRTLSYRSSDADQVAVDRNPKADEFDRWVADRDDVIHTGSMTTLQYFNSPYSYGLWDLYNYGSWFSYGGYGHCWRPYGVGFGWSPFGSGRWAFYPGFGWTWISFEPWGWLPYHYGSWVFSPTAGWLWVPGFSRQWQPATAVWVRARNQVGVVPLHPQDQPGLTPANLEHGVVIHTSGSGGVKPLERMRLDPDERAELLRGGPPVGSVGDAPRLPTPARVGTPPAREGRDERGIVFDPKERKFVNNPKAPAPAGQPPVADTRGDARVDADDSPAPRMPTPATPPRGATGAGGSGPTPQGPPVVRERDVAPRQTPVAPPRAQPPRPMPPPQAQPRTERPPARTESPRPAPRQDVAPRPSAPPRSSASPPAPRPMPRSEPRMPSSSRPHG